jgi:sorbitol-specific phosphotransferase system component IIBC
MLKSLSLTVDSQILSVAKLLCFVILVVLTALRGGISVNYEKESWSTGNILASGLLGLATSALLLATVSTFVADVPLLSPTLNTSATLAPLLAQSQILSAIVSFQDVAFTLPALLVLAVGFYDQWK